MCLVFHLKQSRTKQHNCGFVFPRRHNGQIYRSLSARCCDLLVITKGKMHKYSSTFEVLFYIFSFNTPKPEMK